MPHELHMFSYVAWRIVAPSASLPLNINAEVTDKKAL